MKWHATMMTIMMMMMMTGIFTYGTNTYRYSFRRYSVRTPRTTQLRKVDKSPPCLCTGKASTGRTSFLQSKTFVISLNTFLRITHLYLCIINFIYSNICPKRYFDYLTSENLYWALILIKMCYNNKIVQKENVVSSPTVCI